MLEFLCSTCGKRVQGDDAMAGKQVLCPACNAAITAPQLNATAIASARIAPAGADAAFAEGTPPLPSAPLSIQNNAPHTMKKVSILLVVALAALLAGILWRSWSTAPPERIGVPMADRVEKTEDEWRKILTPEQFQVARRKGTERAGSGIYAKSKDDGVFLCVCCGQPLFDAKTKYESGTGWPSFWQPVAENNVSLISDNTLFMKRTEVTCSRCDAHLGHVFDDGPAPTGLRYCMNSASLKLVKRDE